MDNPQLLSSAELDDTPSRRDGISKEMENTLRVYGCEMLQEAGILMKLPQVAVATGQVLFHRYYFHASFKTDPPQRVALGALFLGAKVEDVMRKISDFITAFHYINRRRKGLPTIALDHRSAEYWQFKEDLIATERAMLTRLGFHVNCEHPHKFILSYLRALHAEKNAEFAQKAWNFLNDSLRTTMCVRFRPEVMAAAGIFLASRTLSIALPENPPWWEVFDATKQQITEICEEVLLLYTRPKVVDIDTMQATITDGLWTPHISYQTSPLIPPASAAIPQTSAPTTSIPSSSSLSPLHANSPGAHGADRRLKSIEEKDDNEKPSRAAKRSRSRDRDRDRDKDKDRNREVRTASKRKKSTKATTELSGRSEEYYKNK